MSWLSQVPTSGTIAPAASQTVDVAFDSTGLTAGTFNVTVNVNSNDPLDPLVQVPVTLTVIPPPPMAITDLSLELDTDAAVGVTPAILQVNDPVTGDPLPGVLIGGYQASLSYTGTLVNVLEVRLKLPFDTGAANIDNPAGSTQFSAIAPAGAPWPIDPLAFLTLRLTGCVDELATVDLSFDEIVDVDDNPIAPAKTLTFQRADATENGQIGVGDALFISQYLVGLKDLSEVNALNAASVKYDGAFDVVSVADALYILQYGVGLRDYCMNLLP